MLSAVEPIRRAVMVVAHSGVLTGHWEFDLALLFVFLAIINYSFLLPQDAPRGIGRIAIYIVSFAFLVGALVLAVVGFRGLVEGV